MPPSSATSRRASRLHDSMRRVPSTLNWWACTRTSVQPSARSRPCEAGAMVASSGCQLPEARTPPHHWVLSHQPVAHAPVAHDLHGAGLSLIACERNRPERQGGKAAARSPLGKICTGCERNGYPQGVDADHLRNSRS